MEYINQLLQNLSGMEQLNQLVRDVKDKASFKEMEYTKQKRNLEKIKEIVLMTDVKRFKNDTDRLNRRLVEDVLKEILQDYFSIDELTTYFSKTRINKQILSSEYDTVIEKDRTTNKLVSILIMGYNFYTIIPSLAHEYTHDKIDLETTIETTYFLGNIHYNELASILMEQIVAKEAEEILELPISYAMNNTRINHIKTIVEILRNLETVPINDPRFKLILEYQQHQTYTYLLSDIYATAIFEKYTQDKEQISYYTKQLLNHQTTIDTILTDLNISLKERDVINTYQKKIRGVS